MWHSNVDIKGVANVSETINYLKKYISKCANFDSNDSKGIKTLAQCWAYRKRAYCLSGVFKTRMTDLIANMHNSNSQLIQKSLDGEEFEENKWSCLGFVSIEVLGVQDFVWRLALEGELRERVYEDIGERETKND